MKEPFASLLPCGAARNFSCAALAALLMAALSFYAFHLSRQHEIDRAREEFSQHARRLAESIQSRLNTFEDAAGMVAALAETQQKLSREDFAVFVRGLMDDMPGFSAFAFAPHVTFTERASLEEEARAQGLAGYSVTQPDSGGVPEPAGQRDEYYPVLFLEPLPRDKRLLGEDLLADPAVSPALEASRRSGLAAASGMLPTQEDGERLLLLLHPVYPRGIHPQGQVGRKDDPLGFSVGLFRPGALLNAALNQEELPCVRVWLRDPATGAAIENAPSGCAEEPRPSSFFAPSPVFRESFALEFPQRHLELAFASEPGFLAGHATWQPTAILAAGLTVSLLLGLFLRNSLRLAAQGQARMTEKLGAEEKLGRKVQELEQAQEQAQENARILKAILQGIQAATFTIDARSFTITDMNPVAEKLFSITREEWLGKPYRDLLGRNLSGLAQAEDQVQALPGEENAAASGEFLLRRRDGKLIPLSRTVLSGKDTGGRYIFEILFDISAQKAMERKLGLAQKLESIGQLASGIAHEINTPIQYVGGNLGFLHEVFRELTTLLAEYDALIASTPCESTLRPRIEELKGKARFETLLTEIPESINDSMAGVERVAGIVGAMKRFSHPEGGKRLLDVNKAVESTLTISRNEWKYHSEVAKKLDPNLPLLFCSPGDFNQALLNVVINAAHAVAEKYQGTDEKGLISVATSQEDGWIVVSVSDTGVGIPKENIDRIFDPFFTTKEVGKGTGQGLAIVHSVVDQHGGSISIESTPGAGTTFILRFPAVSEETA